MNAPRSIALTDELLRVALTEEPPNSLAGELARELGATVRATPQLDRHRIRLPWGPLLPGLPGSAAQQRVRAVAILGLLVVVGLLALTLIAIAAGSLRRPAPFGLAKPGMIAFDSGGQIFIANSDGTDRRQITTGTAFHANPTWSPDGTMIAFWSQAVSSAPAELTVVDATGGHRRVIGVTSAVGTQEFLIYGSWWRIAWSPDSRRIAYTAYEAGATGVFVAFADGSGSGPIGDPSLEGVDPTWSPDGARIAFRGGRYDADRGIYVMRADGSDIRRLTRTSDETGGAYAYFQPVWSPHGDWIAFTRPVPSGSHVFLVAADGSRERDLSDLSGLSQTGGPASDGSSSSLGDIEPVWSPDGSFLAFLRGENDNFVENLPTQGHIAVVRPDGSGLLVLPPVVGGGIPIWSPDGTHISTYLYNESQGSADRVIVISVKDGSSVVIGGGDTQGFGSWQRLAP